MSLYGRRESLAAQLAVDAINADSVLLAGHTLTLKIVDDGGSPWTSMRAACELMRGGVHALTRQSRQAERLVDEVGLQGAQPLAEGLYLRATNRDLVLQDVVRVQCFEKSLRLVGDLVQQRQLHLRRPHAG